MNGASAHDWMASRLGDFAKVTTGTKDVNEGNPRGRYPFFTCAQALSYSDDYSFDEEAILVAGNGAVGNLHFYDGKFEAYQRTYVVREISCNTRYLWHAMEFGLAKSIGLETIGTSIPYIKKENITGFEFQIPKSPEEQAKIATILDDADVLLDSLDALIFKKRDIKQGAMQQLVSGKSRLPGFHGKWKTSTLGELFEIESGKSKSAHLSDSGRYIVVDMGGISSDGALSAKKRTNSGEDILSAGALVMPKDDIGGGKIIGKVAHIPVGGRYVLGDHVYLLTPKGCDSMFLKYVINSETVNREMRSKVVGSAQLGLGRKSVISQSIDHPELCEQQAIAEVLSDLDKEITALVKQREKTALIKIGMMQNLLTGKVRL